MIQKFDVNNDEYIYKFGKTRREISKRLNEHGNETKLLLCKLYSIIKLSTSIEFDP